MQEGGSYAESRRKWKDFRRVRQGRGSPRGFRSLVRKAVKEKCTEERKRIRPRRTQVFPAVGPP